MEISAIGRRRRLAQLIDGEQFRSPEETVRWMGALQAQSYPQALWAIGARAGGTALTDIEQAIADRKIIRTWPMRGTLHFIPPENAKWMLGLTAERMINSSRGRFRQLGIDEEMLLRSKRVLAKALESAGLLTRSALFQTLEEAGISTAGQRGAQLIWHAALTGLLCHGPREDRQQTFALLDEWVPEAAALPRDEGLAKLALLYFRSHGPATLFDFAWWAGVSVADARRGLEAVSSQLLREAAGDMDYWMDRAFKEPPEATASDASSLRLLPGFDEFLLGYKDRRAVLAEAHSPAVIPGKNGMFLPIVIRGSTVIGVWSQERSKAGISVTVKLFEPIEQAEEQLEKAVQAYASFAELPVASLTLLS